MNRDTSPAEIVVSVGSNCGERELNVSEGLAWLRGVMTSSRFSSVYETPDCHGGERRYLNAVGTGITNIPIEDLTALIKEQEKKMGRTEQARKSGDVPIDIDIVVYDGRIIRDSDFRRQFFKIGYEEIRNAR